MSIGENDKQPDSVSSVLKVFGILQALGVGEDAVQFGRVGGRR